MAIEAFDTHRAVKDLKAAGFGDSQAEALVDTIGTANTALHNFATKEDLTAFATKEDLKAFATKEDLKAFATKEDLKAFATKEDLKAFATKEDLNAFSKKEDLSALANRFEERIDVWESRFKERFTTGMLLLEQRLTIKFGVGLVAIVAAVVGLVRGFDFLAG